MADANSTPSDASVRLRVPQDLEAGVYANHLTVWHTIHEFTLDFAVLLPAEQHSEDASSETRCQVVARVRLPPGLALAAAQAITTDVERYFRESGVESREGAGSRSQGNDR